MKNIFKNNLSKIEKIIMITYMIYIAYVKIVYDKFLFDIVALIFIIFIASKRKNKETDANYIIKEKLDLIIRHFLLLYIFWDIIFGILSGEFIYSDGIIDIFFFSILLVVLLLPFAGILKAISKLKKIETHKEVKIYTELPDDIEPAIIAHLLQNKNTDRTDLSATLLDLVRKKYLIIKENNFEDITKGKPNITLKKNPNKDWYKLKGHQKFLIEWFFRISDTPDEIKMSDLKNNLVKSQTWREDYNKWLQLIKEEAETLNFYDNKSKLSKFNKISIKLSKLMTYLAIFLLIPAIYEETFNFLPEAFNLFAIITLVLHYIISILAIIIYDLRVPENYLSDKGIEKIRQWNGFIEYLKEYSLIDKREIQEVYLWEEYLVYGVAFGVADTTIKAMNNAYGLNLDEIY